MCAELVLWDVCAPFRNKKTLMQNKRPVACHWQLNKLVITSTREESSWNRSFKMTKSEVPPKWSTAWKCYSCWQEGVAPLASQYGSMRLSWSGPLRTGEGFLCPILFCRKSRNVFGKAIEINQRGTICYKATKRLNFHSSYLFSSEEMLSEDKIRMSRAFPSFHWKSRFESFKFGQRKPETQQGAKVVLRMWSAWSCSSNLPVWEESLPSKTIQEWAAGSKAHLEMLDLQLL